MESSPITVTSPLLPSLSELTILLKDIWDRKWLTNNGYYHKKLEEALTEYLCVPYVSLFTNGTLPLIVALQVLNIKGEVITTPYSFIATSNSIFWNNAVPVFVDVDIETGNIDPSKIESAITSKTTAIMPVHVYGVPCEVEKIQSIANKYNLKIIYDAAHAFGVKIGDKSVLEFGDISTLSFHATKVFNTVEGGALICHNEEIKKQADSLRNFGFIDDKHLVAPGMNSKMDEIRSAYGLLNLKQVEEAIKIRKRIAHRYISGLQRVPGIRTFIDGQMDIKYNYSYFPIFINEIEYGITRDMLYERMKGCNIIARKYFYPLISDFSAFSQFKSSSFTELANAHMLADNVICLPIHTALSEDDVNRIINCIIDNHRS